MPAPLVSVVMAAFNGAAFIREAIDSVLAQSMADFELLVIDDGSTDDTARIVESFADPRIHLVRNPGNFGIAMSRNIGLALARGRFVAVMDSDDIAASDRLAVQVEFFAGNPDVAVCGSDLHMFGLRSSKSDVPSADADIKALFLAAAGNILNPTAMWRRDLSEGHGLRYRPDLAVGSDYAFWVACMRAGARFANIKRPLVRYRWHGGNVSKSSERKRTCVAATRAELLAAFFPSLTGNEVAALANLFAGKPLTFDAMALGFAAGRAAQAQSASCFGENRELLGRILDRQLHKVQRAIEKGPRPPGAGSGEPRRSA